MASPRHPLRSNTAFREDLRPPLYVGSVKYLHRCSGIPCRASSNSISSFASWPFRFASLWPFNSKSICSTNACSSPLRSIVNEAIIRWVSIAASQNHLRYGKVRGILRAWAASVRMVEQRETHQFGPAAYDGFPPAFAGVNPSGRCGLLRARLRYRRSSGTGSEGHPARAETLGAARIRQPPRPPR